jgi:outer membrane protein OmpA-like peptidoglycan-associated protein/tetratricopeptide (TPR) repeat protein
MRFSHMLRAIFLILICVPSILLAQVVTNENANKKATKAMEQGIQLAMGMEYEAALQAFQAAIDAEPRFINAWIFAGDVCSQTGQYALAKTYYEGAIDIQDDYDVSVYKKIAEAQQMLMEYDAAIASIRIFLDNPNIVGETRKKANRFLSSVEFAADAVLNPVPFQPVNMGAAVNSHLDEYFPSLSADKSLLVFTRNLIDTLERPEGGFMLRRNEDFFLSISAEDTWSAANNMGRPVNSTFNEGAQCISADGRWLYYTLCNGPAGFGSCDIYYAFQNFGIWSTPENCGKRINSANWDSQPSISADGKFLFFTSNRPGGLGGSDLWASKMGPDGYWETAYNLGAAINTPADESSPFMHPDGVTLYFASDGHPGMGGTDLFYSKLDPASGWQTPVNLGYPLNTSGMEATLHVSTDGGTAFYSSDREDSYGGLDLYSFPMPDIIRPDPVTYVKAFVKSEHNKQPLAADVQLFDLSTNELVTKSTCNANGEFLVTLPSGKDYALFVNMEGYLFHSENFSLAEGFPDEPYILEVLLKQVSVGEVFTLRNIFFESGSSSILPESEAELKKLLELINNNPSMRISVNGHTDNVGNDADNMRLSEQRASAVAAYLTQHGIDGSRISSKGFGESVPIADNEQAEGRALNRRTEIEITGL